MKIFKALSLVLAVLFPSMLYAQSNLVTDEGAWCWFADPRALHYENASGTINASWLGYIDIHGNIKATQYDWKTGRKTDVLVRSYFQPDDHNNPTFVVLPDERVMMFYTRHTDEAKIWYRISKKPGDISQLGEEKYLATNHNTTYPSPFILSDDPEHIYLCWRGINWHPTIARITIPNDADECSFDFGPKQIVQSTGARPYAKYQSNGKDKIYVCYTTGHPDNEQPNWLYFNVIDINQGNGPILRDIKGTQLSIINNGVFNVKKEDSYANSYPYTIVDRTSGIRNWVWQIALDANENPVIAFPHIDDGKTTHVYWYGRWTGTAWKNVKVASAGHAFHQNWNQTERCYSGGMSLDPDNPSDLYLSIPTKDGVFNMDGIYEIWRYTIDADGNVSTGEQITSNSTKNNMRPFVIPGSKNSPMRLGWMNGDYYYWMVNKNYPQGYPTKLYVNYDWEEEKAASSAEIESRSIPSSGGSLSIGFSMNADKYEGKLWTSGDESVIYSLDSSTLYPELTINGVTYKSQNKLLTSDGWATGSNGTNGDNHPTKLTTWVFTLTYDGHTLTTYRDGFVDQVIDIEGFEVNYLTLGVGSHEALLYKAYERALTPMEVQDLMMPFKEEMREKMNSRLPKGLLNGDFESSYKPMENSGVENDRAIYVPEGWSIDYASGNVNDLTALKSGDLYFDRFFGDLAKPEANGSQTYWIRQNWGTSTITLWQKMLLPEGDYTLTADLWKSGLGGDANITITTEAGDIQKSASLENKAEWQQVTMKFNSDGKNATTIALVAMHNSNGSEKIIGFDNITLAKDTTVTPDPIIPSTITEWTFRLKNTQGFARTNETVELTVPEGLDLKACSLQDEMGTTVPFEITPDGRARFQTSVAAAATTGYKFVPGSPGAPDKLTYAAVKQPSSRADIAWENDLNAYRMYSSQLLSSEPNTAQGIDVWYKKLPTPVIDDMYNTSWHNESQYGVDAYSVNGKRLGCGGTAAVINGALQMHNPYTTCTVNENANLGSAFTVVYDNVSIGSSSYTKTLKVETLASSLLNRATVRFDGPQQTIRLAVALYEHTDMTSVNPEGVDFTDVAGLIGRAENKSEGSVTSSGARFYQGAYVPTQQPSGITVNPTTEIIDNHLCLVVDYTIGTELTFYFGGGWSIFPTGCYGSDADWFSALEQFKQQVDAPLTATSFQDLPQKDDVLHILNTVNQTWQQRNATHGDHFWNRAVYHIGNMEAYAATGDQQYLDFSTAWAEHNNWKGATGTDKSKWKYSYGESADYVLFGDNQVCFQIYADLYNLDPTHDTNKIARAREVMEYEMSTNNEDYLWWVDGLFMVMPIMTKLYNITGNEQYLSKMYTYWKWYTDRMYDTEEDLYYRDANYVYPAHKTNAGKKDFWARGDGWIFAAFAKVLAELPETDSHRDEYISYYRRMAAALKACQQPTGYWERSLLDPEQANGYETSGTALFAYGYAWGIRNGILDEVEYGHTLEMAWKYLTEVAYQNDGTVGFIQPIGSAAVPGQILTAANYHDFGVGAYLMAAAEMSRLAVGDMEMPKLRLANAAIGEANEIIVTFNGEPDSNEAASAANYQLIFEGTGTQLIPEDIAVNNRTATLTFAEPLGYGRYTLNVSNIHSALGGEMANGQTRTLLRTVPLTPAPKGITITAIGAQSGNPATNAADNDLSTRWSQQGASGQWLQIDLKSNQQVYAVDIAVYNGTSRKNYFDIQTSTDKVTFNNVLTGMETSGLTNELERYLLPETTEARYVRVVCNGTSAGDWNSITEVRVRVRDTSIDDIHIASETYGDMLLPATTADGNTILWTSTDKEVLSGAGYATPGDNDQTVTLTATVGEENRTFDVIVRARNVNANKQLLYTFNDEDISTNGTKKYISDRTSHQRHGEIKGTKGSVHDGMLDLTGNTASGFSQNGYVLAPKGLIDSLRSYTVVVIATPSALDKSPRLYDFGSGSGNSVFLRANGLAAGVKYNGGTTELLTSSSELVIGKRQELAVTFDARTHITRIYVDRILIEEGTNITREPYEIAAIAADTRNYIGRTQWWDTSVKADNPDFIGTIEEIQVYSLALTDEELATIFDDIATGISMNGNQSVNADVTTYDLSGRKLNSVPQNLPKGIYVIKGQKLIVR